MIAAFFSARGFGIARTASGDHRDLTQEPPSLVLFAIESDFPDPQLAWIRRIRRANPNLPIIAVAHRESEAAAVAAFRAGATDYLRQPLEIAELEHCVNRCLGEIEAPFLRQRGTAAGSADLLVGSSASMQRVREGIAKLARVNSHVLITGETGTGKELAAELIHRMSPRGHRPFVCLNCAAIPDTLLESELFGYERGAFTGAFGSQRGKLEEAEDGTIFFDEVGDMSMAAQAKVLRTIENREVSRLGSHGLRVIRCRVVAATNQDLERCVVEGQFRKDLYFRLNVARLQLPPLRDRMEDIPELCVRFIRQFNQEMGAAVERLSDEVLRDFTNYHWPGNVRELKNTVEATFIVAQSGTITRDMLPPLFRLGAGSSGLAGERDQLLATLLETNGNKSRAAEKLNFSRMTLYRKLARHRIGGKETPSAGTA